MTDLFWETATPVVAGWLGHVLGPFRPRLFQKKGFFNHAAPERGPRDHSPQTGRATPPTLFIFASFARPSPNERVGASNAIMCCGEWRWA